MKVLALVATSAGRDPQGKRLYNEPGVIEIDDAAGEALIRNGQAKRIAQVEAEKAAAVGEVVITKAAGPVVNAIPAVKAEAAAPAGDAAPAADSKTAERPSGRGGKKAE